MKYFDWDEEKNKILKSQRGIGFEDALIAVEENNVIDDLAHPRRKNQRILVIKHGDYAYLVPYVEDDEKIFLKTIIPSRKATRDYLKGGKP
jgi:uncharacterized DUF497 family protein